MSGRLTTHVLDTMHGCPAAGMRVVLRRLAEEGGGVVKEIVTNADGRSDTPLLTNDELEPGSWELTFEVGSYFRASGVALPAPAFLERVPIRFGIADVAAHYHVPLLVSPYAYSTYRGS